MTHLKKNKEEETKTTTTTKNLGSKSFTRWLIGMRVRALAWAQGLILDQLGIKYDRVSPPPIIVLTTQVAFIVKPNHHL